MVLCFLLSAMIVLVEMMDSDGIICSLYCKWKKQNLVNMCPAFEMCPLVAYTFRRLLLENRNQRLNGKLSVGCCHVLLQL